MGNKLNTNKFKQPTESNLSTLSLLITSFSICLQSQVCFRPLYFTLQNNQQKRKLTANRCKSRAIALRIFAQLIAQLRNVDKNRSAMYERTHCVVAPITYSNGRPAASRSRALKFSHDWQSRIFRSKHVHDNFQFRGACRSLRRDAKWRPTFALAHMIAACLRWRRQRRRRRLYAKANNQCSDHRRHTPAVAVTAAAIAAPRFLMPVIIARARACAQL